MLAMQMATINTARHYGLNDLGAIAPGYHADMVTFRDLSDIRPTRTFAAGTLVAENKAMLEPMRNQVLPPENNMTAGSVTESTFRITATGRRARVIRVLPEQIVTIAETAEVKTHDGEVVADVDRDLLKIAVVERHRNTGHVGLGLVTGMGLRAGALASSIAHDSHNVVVIGTNDADMALAAQTVNQMQGGIAAVSNGDVLAQLALPVAGLMSDQPHATVRDGMIKLLSAARTLGSPLSNPYMQMAFLALPSSHN